MSGEMDKVFEKAAELFAVLPTLIPL